MYLPGDTDQVEANQVRLPEFANSKSFSAGWSAKELTFARSLLRVICILTVLSASKTQAQQDGPVIGASANPGAPLFDSVCGVCHGSDGRGGERAPNIATKREMVNLSDAQLNSILHKGVLASGMPAFSYLGDAKIRLLVGRLRELQGISGSTHTELAGDVEEGEKTFFAEGSCSQCHMVHGKGGFLGEDLSSYGRGRSAEAIRAAITHPDSAGPTEHLAEIQTAEGASYSGLIRWRDNFTVILQGRDGEYHSLPRNRIQKMLIDTQPLMPQNYEIKLDEKRLTDLISYLLRASALPTSSPKSGIEERP